MESTELFEYATKFLRDHNVHDDVIAKWMSEADKCEIYGTKVKKQKRTKNSYMFFCDDERQRLKNENPPIIQRNEVHRIMSANWILLKEKGGPDYEKYVHMANDRKLSVKDPSVVYEVSKPFHKFSLDNRKQVEDEFNTENANEITNRLISDWRKLPRTERSKYWFK